MAHKTAYITERLRDYNEGPGWPSLKKQFMLEAADEIDRLRMALEAIADGEGDAQEIARRTLERVNP
ncbi:hypothetical protein [Microvirga lotononidis]|uniref:Uncharacterized protein n=1 Tax=Microvirga lotononidis TaxID=864069 RepID=I4YP02_9HYPH|nr:hypothetical protein [Microvirga lotononidis]EIM25694.1 hypothetical protein MicloDRAFT_00064210 [Microvirga lotononidis]WQO25631.1 hypothetical protein U0023_12980 [Microvirga lotononidis]